MVIENKIDMGPIVRAMVIPLAKPYKDFVSKLHAEGRITDLEVKELAEAILSASDGLYDSMREELRKDPGEWKVAAN